jgi:hypothetical protein
VLLCTATNSKVPGLEKADARCWFTMINEMSDAKIKKVWPDAWKAVME